MDGDRWRRREGFNGERWGQIEKGRRIYWKGRGKMKKERRISWGGIGIDKEGEKH